MDGVSSGVSAEALDWMASWWDDDVAMLWNPPGSFDALFAPRSLHLVPPTVWYALGLLRRRADGDVENAVRAIGAVIGCQLVDPGAPWHGTFARFREFPDPQPGAVEYAGFDPNWRQFVGTGFALAIILAGDVLPGTTVDAMVAAIALAVDGEPPDRVGERYSNIALMRAWLEVQAGHLLDRDELASRGEELAGRTVERFDLHGTLDEWNSPTYYGIDLYALALWRSHSSSPQLRDWGRRLEADLWVDLAPWYHAGLGNVAGPYTRAYGMDMRRYVAALGLWIQAADTDAAAPVPELSRPFSHSHDLALAPVIAALDTRVPVSAQGPLSGFEGERRLERVVSSDPERIASAWLSADLMVGAERGGRRWPGWGQYHPATVHWRDPDDRTRWIRLVHSAPVEARAEPHALVTTCTPHARRGPQPTTFLVSAADALEGDVWRLPGLTVRVRTDAEFVGVSRSGELDELRYEPPASGTASFWLSFEA
jgi:hypothetical protein